MRLRRKIFGFLTLIVGLSLIFPLILPIFYSVEANGNLTNDGYKIFDEFVGMSTRFKALNGNFQPAFANMTSVCAVISIVLYGLFLIFFLLQLSKKGRLPTRAILKSISVTMILVAILTLICSLTFVIMNKITFNEKTLLSFKFAYGTYILLISSFLTGLFGVVAELKYRRKY